MSMAEQIARYMSLRAPQKEALDVLEAISDGLDYRSASIETVAATASEKSAASRPVTFDTQFPSFCFALATGVGKTRLMGACMYHLWWTKGYRNFFILAPNLTIYEKLRTELNPVHPKYMFVGLSDFPSPEVYDGDNYLRFNPAARLFDEKQARIFIFNISKIFAARSDTQFRFHRFNETLGDSFSAMLQQMGDLVILMDESHRYRAPASLAAMNHLKPVLGLEFTATPKYKDNIICAFPLAAAIGKFVKTPTIITRTNLTIADASEIERLKLLDGLARHEIKKARLIEYCQALGRPRVKPFVLVSTKDTEHAREIWNVLNSDGFQDGAYKGKVIEIHSGLTGAESDENIAKLLEVENPNNSVEVVIHVNMLKEGWDVANLYTIIPLRASISEILTEQTIGRGLRLPFGELTGDEELDALEIVSHDQYSRLLEAAKGSPLFHIKQMEEKDFRPVKTIQIKPKYVDLDEALERLTKRPDLLFATSDLENEDKFNHVVNELVAEEEAAYHARAEAAATTPIPATIPGEDQPPEALPFDGGQGPKPAPVFDKAAATTKLREKLKTLREAYLDVPNIYTEAEADQELEAFQPMVTTGPFDLVDQRVKSADLATGAEHLGDKLEVMSVENPRAFLAGRLIDSLDEWDVLHNKETALALVDSYLGQLNKPTEELGQLVHLYRDIMLRDLKTQVEAHIKDRTKVTVHVHSGFIRWPPFNKTVLVESPIVNLRDHVPKSDVSRYCFEGITKSYYQGATFDSTPEKEFAIVLEDDPAVLKWVRPPEGSMPISYRGKGYNPDFVAETGDKKYLIEVKMRRELSPMDQTVKEKALAAIRWCEEASTVPGGKPWEYKLIPDDTIQPTYTLQFIFGQAVKVNP